ncbi:TPA: hypothetical protein JAN60_07510 [Legionella pneumophila]|uniref:hypothetical protein n=1 Tax=Legionella pneumophila TaxID=446 RepID=UPI0010AA2705|nr:hypothetical protein [Legionella pneumophila]TIG67081.1 hypothetical protein DI132_04215 [Legionella pneumophila]TIG72982.1 hypothetical protein DI104_05735 [Legionella pneumophila]HAT3863335.1 hypothetical protein [Legionella pneumophila]HAT3872668.1 hypothetical protein [Legionella pneumophila]HAT7047770.1 hypothetical protein [Legionella pneumophila]
MLRIVVKVIFFGTLVTPTSFATTSLNTFLFEKKPSPKIKIQNNVTTNSIKGTDFSGKWAGSCKNMEGPAQIYIEQLEDSITINGQDFKFGAMTMSASSNNDSYDNSQIRFTWNPKKTVLKINGTSINTSNNDKTIFTSISETSLTLNNDQLVMKIKAKSFNNLDSMDEAFNGNCIFTKVP